MASASSPGSVVLVDGFGLIFRAYYGLPTTMSTASGEQTNAVYGFASMLLDVIKKRNPEYVVIALETGKTFRHDLYPAYKGTRASMPDDLREQLERVRELIDVLNIPVKMQDNFEADDVIGTLSRKLAAEGHQVYVITGDSDLLQLVGENITVVLPGARRFGELREFGIEEVIERYGFGPEYVPDYKALVGDTSDNIPGVPGVGEKTAKALIMAYGPVETIFANRDHVTPTRARNALLAEGTEEQALESKHLATIVRDMDIELDLQTAELGDYDRDAAIELFRVLEFRNLLDKLPDCTRAGVNGVAVPTLAAEKPESIQTVVHTNGQLAEMLQRIRDIGEIALDVETTSVDPMTADLVGIAIAVSNHESWYVPVGHRQGEQLSLGNVRAGLAPVLSNPNLKLYTHHGKYDLQVMARHGFADREINFDTMIAAYLLGEHSLRLKDLSFNRLGIQQTEISELIGTGKNQQTMDNVAIDLAAPYAMADVECTFGLVAPLRADLEAREQMPLLTEIELPLAGVLMRMERRGIAINPDELGEFSAEMSARLEEIDTEVDGLAGRPISISSNKQIGTLLFDEFKLPAGKKTKTGYSVDSDVLEGLKNEHAVVPLILEHRALSKLRSTYADALPTYVNPTDGRVHTTYNQTVAATGRLASTNPNLQNIPIRTELGRRIRRAFIADHRADHGLVANSVLLSADYSQMELRILAHMSGDPALVESFRSGADIHRATAALVNDVPIDDVTGDMRRIAKTVNFGILYGMQAFGLSRDTGMPRAEAQQFIDRYWERLPKVREFFDTQIEFGKQHGYVETLRGRRRYLPDLNSSNGLRRQGAVRMAMNMPIQGTQADMIKIAMINLERRLIESGLPGYMLLQVHDELVLELDGARIAEIAPIVRETMETAMPLDVPVVTEMKIGDNWEDMTPYQID
ncbi:MAG: DNA polymerase I [Thermomicrobiales bacterium]|nr:DNA polymerase I [Thermomicrobiales bacterium]